MQAFIAHWLAVNSQLDDDGLPHIVLPTAYTVATLTTDRADIADAITAVQPALNQLQAAANNRNNKKVPLRERIRQFRAAAQSYLKGSQYINALPRLPRFDASPGDFTKALDDMSSLWATINALPPPGFTAPLKLIGAYTLANFNTEVTAMKAAFTAWDAAYQNAAIVRGQRDMLLPPVKPRLSQYRQAVLATFPPGNALVLSLPAVRPPSGSTPKAVQISGLWNGTSSKAHLEWTASANPNLDHYSIRSCDPPRYRAADESVVASVAAGTTVFDTDDGLLAAGSAKIFKVYVVTHDDNEKGSNSVKITHPE